MNPRLKSLFHDHGFALLAPIVALIIFGTLHLTGVWQQGGLVGARAEDAFSVSCGVGETMTAQDILDGVLLVTVQVAVIHPAEFIEITFQQQMQKS